MVKRGRFVSWTNQRYITLPVLHGVNLDDNYTKQTFNAMMNCN